QLALEEVGEGDGPDEREECEDEGKVREGLPLQTLREEQQHERGVRSREVEGHHSVDRAAGEQADGAKRKHRGQEDERRYQPDVHRNPSGSTSAAGSPRRASWCTSRTPRSSSAPTT